MAETHPPRVARRDVEPVRSVRTPAALDYTFTAGQAQSRFLRGIDREARSSASGHRAGKVYVPARGADPELRRAHDRAGRARPRRAPSPRSAS